MNLFKQSEGSPFHISVAALFTNEKKELLCHHFSPKDLPHESEGKRDVYLLMRETLEPHETLESALTRGLLEEFGATGEIIDYLGSIQSHFPYTHNHKIVVEKTTLYFEVRALSVDESKREVGAVESRSTLVWLSPFELLEKTIQQSEDIGRDDINDEKVIRAFIKKYNLSQ